MAGLGEHRKGGQMKTVRYFRAVIFSSILSGLFVAALGQAPTVSVSPPAPAGKATPSAMTQSKEPSEKWEQELLRDPFWPVGFFPPDWKKAKSVESGADLDGSGWKSASAKLQISGTSRLGDRTAAIINGQLKVAGDPVEIFYEGKTYQWLIVDIDADGQIQLKKTGIK
jgi:hypothetical protein